jgi:hypothetical protein
VIPPGGRRPCIQQQPHTLDDTSRHYFEHHRPCLSGAGACTSVWPYWAASCSGVYMRSLAMLGSAPCSNRSFTVRRDWRQVSLVEHQEAGGGEFEPMPAWLKVTAL